MMKKILKKSVAVKILVGIVTVVCLLVLLAELVLHFWAPLGGKTNKNDREDYAKRADNFKDGIFQNTKHFEMIDRSNDQNVYFSEKDVIPKESLEAAVPDFPEKPEKEDLTVTWLGHSTLLLQMSGMNILTDPVFSDYASPVRGAGPERFSELPLEIEELPDIDIVLITHDHYDHLDYHSIRKLKDKVGVFIVPLGIEKHLERWGVKEEQIYNMAWWEEYRINDLTIALTPARHYSGRSINDRFQTLWGSYVLQNENYKVYESGDSGYDDHFQKIQEKYGDFDLVLMECGQYNTMWPSTHMTPEFSVQASTELHAKAAMPIHWGTFKLSSHPWDDPVERFIKKALEENLAAITPKIGETVNYGEYDRYIDHKWWEDIE